MADPPKPAKSFSDDIWSYAPWGTNRWASESAATDSPFAPQTKEKVSDERIYGVIAKQLESKLGRPISIQDVVSLGWCFGVWNPVVLWNFALFLLDMLKEEQIPELPYDPLSRTALELERWIPPPPSVATGTMPSTRNAGSLREWSSDELKLTFFALFVRAQKCYLHVIEKRPLLANLLQFWLEGSARNAGNLQHETVTLGSNGQTWDLSYYPLRVTEFDAPDWYFDLLTNALHEAYALMFKGVVRRLCPAAGDQAPILNVFQFESDPETGAAIPTYSPDMTRLVTTGHDLIYSQQNFTGVNLSAAKTNLSQAAQDEANMFGRSINWMYVLSEFDVSAQQVATDTSGSMAWRVTVNAWRFRVYDYLNFDPKKPTIDLIQGLTVRLPDENYAALETEGYYDVIAGAAPLAGWRTYAKGFLWMTPDWSRAEASVFGAESFDIPVGLTKSERDQFESVPPKTDE